MFLFQNNPVQPPQQKKRVLVWSDSILATTGFGTVSKYILGALHHTGQYQIDQLAINHPTTFHDPVQVPYSILPARLHKPSDPYGKETFLHLLQTGSYDLVLVINDNYVTYDIGSHISEIKSSLLAANKKVFKLIYYYPVDCRVQRDKTGMIVVADRAVAYCQFGADQTRQVLPDITPDIIYHGTDTEIFRPLTVVERTGIRAKLYKGQDPDTFVVLNVNRNSPRKDVARTLAAFSAFKQSVCQKSILYLHMLPVDSGAGYPVDLYPAMEHLGLQPGKDVFFPGNFDVCKGYPADVLNQIYNSADLFLTTHLGEGWGLSATEAMATRLPVVAPDNTVSPEIFGDELRGYLYPCDDIVYIDSSGYRPVGSIQAITAKMHEAYQDILLSKTTPDCRLKQKLDAAGQFTQLNSWKKVGKQWVRLFHQVEQMPTSTPQHGAGEVL